MEWKLASLTKISKLDELNTFLETFHYSWDHPWQTGGTQSFTMGEVV